MLRRRHDVRAALIKDYFSHGDLLVLTLPLGE